MKIKIRTFLIINILVCGSYSCTNDKETSKVELETPQQIELESITGVARVEPGKGLLNIYANSSGKIDKIVALENQQIMEGSPLIILDNTVEKALLDRGNIRIFDKEEKFISDN